MQGITDTVISQVFCCGDAAAYQASTATTAQVYDRATEALTMVQADGSSGMLQKASYGYDAYGNLISRADTLRGAPACIYCDNGSEFCSRLVDLWTYHHQVTMAFSRPGKPTGHAHIESFNGCFRDECLNMHWFESLQETRVKIEDWRQDYNGSGPHRALNNPAPGQYAAQWAEQRLETHRRNGTKTGGTLTCFLPHIACGTAFRGKVKMNTITAQSSAGSVGEPRQQNGGDQRRGKMVSGGLSLTSSTSRGSALS